MPEDQRVVLPDTLVAQLIDNAATVSRCLQEDLAGMAAERERLRAALIRDRLIFKLDSQAQPLSTTYAVDGAHLAEIDRASAYSVSCAVSVAQAGQANEQSSCLSILPHVACLNTLSSGLMMMQEVMMAVKVTEDHPDAVCLIDGSRISTIININSFYAGMQRDLPKQLDQWHRQAQQNPEREPARTIALFESRDWLSPYLTSPRIAGNVKLVTTTRLVEEHMPNWLGRFDDKTFAALVLADGEALAPLPLPRPGEPYHIHHSYPYYRAIDDVGRKLWEAGDPSQIHHIYYRPDLPHGVFKIELNAAFLARAEMTRALFSWWNQEIAAPDLQEPYSFYIADRFAKEAVSVAKGALREITKRDTASSSWAWFFTQPYRTP